jgi:hypothetical protein
VLARPSGRASVIFGVVSGWRRTGAGERAGP